MDQDDIYSLVKRLAVLEGRITPATGRSGLNAQQRSVPQLPALFRPRTQKVLGGDPDTPHPMSGYAVGSCEESAMAEDVLNRVRRSLTDYLKTLEDQIRTDTDLKAKTKNDRDLQPPDTQDHALKPRNITPAARVFEMVTGQACEIHGNDDEGYEIRYQGRSLPTRFKDLTHAEMAIEMYNARLHSRVPKQSGDSGPDSDLDYIEEK